MARVYVAASLTSLREYAAAGLVPAGPDRVVAAAEDEDSEYAALMTAADLSADAQPPGSRRVVLVAETAGDPDADLSWEDVVALHADEAPDADPDDDLAWYATQELDDLLG